MDGDREQQICLFIFPLDLLLLATFSNRYFPIDAEPRYSVADNKPADVTLEGAEVPYAPAPHRKVHVMITASQTKRIPISME